MRGNCRSICRITEVYYIGNVGELDLFHVQAEELSEQIIQGTFLEKTTEHFPRALDTEEMNTSVYRLRATDQTEIEIPMSLFTIAREVHGPGMSSKQKKPVMPSGVRI